MCLLSSAGAVAQVLDQYLLSFYWVFNILMTHGTP
jgi:hypothetical protein